jgi:arylsulfatase A-like enzyme
LIDVAPTILDALGLARPTTDGVSLVRPSDRGNLDACCETFYPEEKAAASPEWAHLRPLKAVRRASARKLVWVDGATIAEEFDLHRDPCEFHPTVVRRRGDDVACD